MSVLLAWKRFSFWQPCHYVSVSFVVFLVQTPTGRLSLLAASLDELVHQEVLQRTKDVFKAKKLPMFGYIDLKQMQEVLEHVLNSDLSDFNGFHVVNRMNGDKFGKNIMVGRSFEKCRGLKTNGTFGFLRAGDDELHLRWSWDSPKGTWEISLWRPGYPWEVSCMASPATIPSRPSGGDASSTSLTVSLWRFGQRGEGTEWTLWKVARMGGEHVYGLHSCFKWTTIANFDATCVSKVRGAWHSTCWAMLFCEQK